jgi:hypothetical protein
MANRDSGYARVSGGNVAVDFAFGNTPKQTNDDRASSPSFNATGGTTGSNLVSYQTATVTAASATGGVVTYTANNSFIAGQLVTITGLSTSAFNLTGVTIGTVSSTQFTVTNAATGTAVTGATAVAKVAIASLPGVGADAGWSTTTDIQSAQVSAANLTKAVGPLTLNVPSDSHVDIINSWDQFPNSPSSGGYNSTGALTATVTGASAANGVVQYVTPNNYFQAGQTVSIAGLYNYVLAGQNQPIATQYYAPTYTTSSNFNLSGVSIQGVNSTGFWVANAATDTALTGVRGIATATVAASASTGSVPTVTGLSAIEADRQLGVADFNTGTITYTTSGATTANAGTVYSQSVTGTQTLGTAVNLVVYRLATGEHAGTQAGTFTYNN